MMKGMMIEEILRQNIQRVRTRITATCERVGRQSDSVRLIAVTKYVGPEIIRLFDGLGIHDLGENRLQVAQPKIRDLSDLPFRWHFIGHLQTNKVRQVLPLFSEIHSVDRAEIITELNRCLSTMPLPHTPYTKGKSLKVFLQVNVSGENTKSGVDPIQAQSLGEQLLDSPYLEWVGLMTMAPEVDDPEEIRKVFTALRQLRDDLSTRLAVPLPRLSMGMSNDFEVAIEEGATDVRIGSLLYEGVL